VEEQKILLDGLVLFIDVEGAAERGRGGEDLVDVFGRQGREGGRQVGLLLRHCFHAVEMSKDDILLLRLMLGMLRAKCVYKACS
jgi:hypothetical protein